MKLLEWLKAYWRDHGTKIICSVIGTLEGAREIAGLIPEDQKKWVSLVIIVLAGGGIRRGFTNSAPTTPDAK